MAGKLLNTQFRLATGRVISGHMNDAELSRITVYLDENELKHPPVEITFDASYLGKPVYMKVGTELRHIGTGFAYVVRHVTAPYMADGCSFVKVLGIVITRPRT